MCNKLFIVTHRPSYKEMHAFNIFLFSFFFKKKKRMSCFGKYGERMFQALSYKYSACNGCEEARTMGNNKTKICLLVGKDDIQCNQLRIALNLEQRRVEKCTHTHPTHMHTQTHNVNLLTRTFCQCRGIFNHLTKTHST